MIPLSTYLKTYRVGDIVDVVANGAVQKGMPYKVSNLHACAMLHIRCARMRRFGHAALRCTTHNKTSASLTVPPGLPRQDRRCLQRHQVRRRRDPLQAGGQPLHREAHQRPCRARPPLAQPRRVPHPCQDQRREEEAGEDRWFARALEETATDAERREDNQRKGQQAGERCADCVRDNDLGFAWAGFSGDLWLAYGRAVDNMDGCSGA